MKLSKEFITFKQVFKIRNDRLHPTQESGRHVCGQASLGRDGRRARRGRRLLNPIRRLHLGPHPDQVHDGRNLAQRIAQRTGSRPLQVNPQNFFVLNHIWTI